MKFTRANHLWLLIQLVLATLGMAMLYRPNHHLTAGSLSSNVPGGTGVKSEDSGMTSNPDVSGTGDINSHYDSHRRDSHDQLTTTSAAADAPAQINPITAPAAIADMSYSSTDNTTAAVGDAVDIDAFSLWQVDYHYTSDHQTFCTTSTPARNYTMPSAADTEACRWLWRFFDRTPGYWEVSDWAKGGAGGGQRGYVIGFGDCKYWVRREDGLDGPVRFGNVDMRDHILHALVNYVSNDAKVPRVGAIGTDLCQEAPPSDGDGGDDMAQTEIEWIIYS
ncbi:Pathogen effector [Microdochium nivale]|nr:Pathogen effector [Microdochium nivale]